MSNITPRPANIQDPSFWRALASSTIDQRFQRIEEALRQQGLEKIVWVPYIDGQKLAWSWARPSSRYPDGRWRIVVQDAEGVLEVQALSDAERQHLWSSGAVERFGQSVVMELSEREPRRRVS